MMPMVEAMEEATHALLQKGVTMQKKDPTYPLTVHDMTNIYMVHHVQQGVVAIDSTIGDQTCAFLLIKARTKESVVVYTLLIP